MDNALKQLNPKFSTEKDTGLVKPQKSYDFPYKVDVDYILKHHAGNIGFAQIIMIFIGALTLPPAIIFPVFGNTELPHRCRMDPDTEKELASRFVGSAEDNFDSIATLVGPWSGAYPSDFGDRHEFGCRRYYVPLMSVTQNRTGLLTIPCDNGYVYKYSADQYPGGIISEWDLVCDQAWMGPFSTAMYMVGMMVGFVLGGMAGDHFGRKITALFACLFEAVSIITVSLSTNFWLYNIFRFALACASAIRIAVLLVLCMEVTTARQRSIINSIWSLIQCFLLRVFFSPLAIWFPKWQWLHGMTCMLSFLSFPAIFMFPESPRWLVSQHRKLDALHEMYKIYLVNRKMKCCRDKAPALTEDAFIELIRLECAAIRHAYPKTQACVPAESQFKTTIKSFINRRVFRNTIQCIILFTGQLATTFGLLFYGNAIRVSIYLVNCLNSATQVPATVISALMYRYCKKRKMPIVIMYVCSSAVLSAASIYNLIVKPESDFVLNICCNLSLILLAAAMNMVFMYVPELFASEARALGLGMASGFGRIGGVICPFINALDADTFHGFPIIIYIGVHLIELVNLFWLPNTSGRNLPDNLDLNKDKEAVICEEPTKQDNEENNEKDCPIWTSTYGEMIASTHVIPSSSDLRDEL